MHLLDVDVLAEDTCARLGYTLAPVGYTDSTACGLRNLGNTCYLNALLFSFSKIPALHAWCGRHQELHQNTQHCVLCGLARDVTELTLSPENTRFPPVTASRRGIWNPAFANTRPQDAQDAFVTLLDRCDDVDLSRLRAILGDINDIELARRRYSTPKWKIFGGLQQQTTTCAQCGACVIDHQPFTDVQLEVDDVSALTLETRVGNHFGHEGLEDSSCEQCPRYGKERVLGTRSKYTEVIRWPTVLVLHLKRWAWTPTGQRKIHRHIAFATKLSLPDTSPYCLRSVVVHSGDAGGGHYTSYVRAQNDRWFFCNDSDTPVEVPTETVLEAQAYLLFYETTPRAGNVQASSTLRPTPPEVPARSSAASSCLLYTSPSPRD